MALKSLTITQGILQQKLMEVDSSFTSQKEINYKTRDHLKIYKKELLASKCIKVFSGSSKSTIVG